MMASVPSARVLLRRAHLDFARGAESLRAWVASGGLSIVPGSFAGLAAKVAAVITVRPVDEDAVHDLADAVKKTRDALDHIAWNAWTTAGGDPKAKVYFPIRASAADVRKTKEASSIPVEVANLFVDSQEFGGGSRLFSTLSAFSAAAKHTHPVLIADPSPSMEWRMPPMHSGLSVGLAFAPRGPLPPPGKAFVVAWSFWHEPPSPDPVGADDPRLEGAPELPDVQVKMSLGIVCRDTELTLESISKAIARATEVLDAYEGMSF